MKDRSNSGAVAHSGGLSLYNTHTRTHPRSHGKSLYNEVRHCTPLRHQTPLDDLASAVQRLTIDRRDPEKFHRDKSEIVAALRRMARKAAI